MKWMDGQSTTHVSILQVAQHKTLRRIYQSIGSSDSSASAAR